MVVELDENTRATGLRAATMRRRLWNAYVRAGTRLQRLRHRLSPSRLPVVHFSWPLRTAGCPCDVDFCDYLRDRQIHKRGVFHFGSGGHHLVGLRNQRDALENDVLALTLAPAEHRAYVRLAIRDATLARHYKVLFADIYSLSAATLPTFDVVSLFHLGEFNFTGSGAHRLDDEGVLGLFVGRLVSGGLLAFYRDSFAFRKISPLIARAVDRRQLEFVEDFRSLAIYRRAGS
jgi:hypothetical protein